MEQSIHAPKRVIAPKHTNTSESATVPKPVTPGECASPRAVEGADETPAVVVQPPVVKRYSPSALRDIGEKRKNIPLPAALVNAMIDYELRCESLKESLFEGDEYHHWHKAWQLQASTPQQPHPQRVEEARFEAEYREFNAKLLESNKATKQIRLTLDRLEERVTELERINYFIKTLAPGESIDYADFLSVPRGVTACKPMFEADVDEIQSASPNFSRHRAKVSAVKGELEELKGALVGLEKVCENLTRQGQESDGVLPLHLSGFKSVGGLARWTLPHVQRLELGIRDLAFNNVGDKQAESNQKVNANPSLSPVLEELSNVYSQSVLPAYSALSAFEERYCNAAPKQATDACPQPVLPGYPDTVNRQLSENELVDLAELPIDQDTTPKRMPGGW